jgi:hypothetical protein
MIGIHIIFLHTISFKQVSTNAKKRIFISLSEHKIKLEIDSNRHYRNYSNICRLNNILLTEKWAIEGIREEI